MEDGAGDRDGQWIACVERVEVNAGAVGAALTHVGAQVELREGAGAGHRRQAVDADAVHAEGDYTEPAGAVEGVDDQVGGQGGLNGGDGHGPVREEKIVPALLHGPGARG